jgi:hypothetical protein
VIIAWSMIAKGDQLQYLFGEQFHRLEWNRLLPFKPILL